MHEACIHQGAHQRHGATDLHQVVHEVLAAGFEVCQHRCFFADPDKVLDGEFHASGVGDGDQVEHRVGAAAEGDDESDGVFKRFLRHDIAGGDAAIDHVHYCSASIEAVDEFVI